LLMPLLLQLTPPPLLLLLQADEGICSLSHH
jgi:hypothetical protein